MASKQQKITTVFMEQKGRYVEEENTQGGDEMDESQIEVVLEENNHLKQVLLEKESRLLYLQQKRLQQPRRFQPSQQAAIQSELSTGGEILLRNKYNKLKKRLEIYLNMFGIQVKSYTDDFCTVLYNIDLEDKNVAQYALQFVKIPGSDNWQLTKYSVPLGFDIFKIMEDHEPMSLDYMRLLQVALVSHHNRQQQIKTLKEEVESYVHVYHSFTGLQVEISFPMVSKEGNASEVISTFLHLQYDPFDNRPKHVKIIQNYVTEMNSQAESMLLGQFEELKHFSLPVAFKSAVQNKETNYFYCPQEDQLDVIYSQQDGQFAPRQSQQTNTAVRNESSDEDLAPPQPKHSHKNAPTSRNQPRHHPDFDQSSDESSADSFTTLRQQMKKNKKIIPIQKEPVESFKKPKEAMRPVRIDSNDRYRDNTDVTVDRRRRNTSTSDISRTSEYRVTDTNLTHSYVYIPEAKVKRATKSTKSTKSSNKENSKTPVAVKKGKTKKSR